MSINKYLYLLLVSQVLIAIHTINIEQVILITAF